MKRIGDFALVAIAVILLVGLFLIKDNGRYQIYQDKVVIHLLDRHTGKVWQSHQVRNYVPKYQWSPLIEIKFEESN